MFYHGGEYLYLHNMQIFKRINYKKGWSESKIL